MKDVIVEVVLGKSRSRNLDNEGEVNGAVGAQVYERHLGSWPFRRVKVYILLEQDAELLSIENGSKACLCRAYRGILAYQGGAGP